MAWVDRTLISAAPAKLDSSSVLAAMMMMLVAGCNTVEGAGKAASVLISVFNAGGTKLVFASNRNGKQPRETNIFVADWIVK